MSPSIITLTLAALATTALATVYPDSCNVFVNPTIIIRTAGSVGPFFHDHAFINYDDSGFVLGLTSQSYNPTSTHSNHTHTVTSGMLYFDAFGEKITIQTEKGLCAASVAGKFVAEACTGDARQLFNIETFDKRTYIRSNDNLYITVGKDFEGPVLLGSKRNIVIAEWNIVPCNSILVDATKPEITTSTTAASSATVPPVTTKTSAIIKTTKTVDPASSATVPPVTTSTGGAKVSSISSVETKVTEISSISSVETKMTTTSTGGDDGSYGGSSVSALPTTTIKGEMGGKKGTLTDNLYIKSGSAQTGTGLLAAVILGVAAALFV
ncbi:hypothetical protein BC829DRAFT_390806 [Chytridium lagenaria]|nr:hypothetical protein BC829DRAFT_390806 [Chytridium lagenaria]